ncbi:ClpXP protease specificity-enhancing factor [Sediminicurvatus halobius]|uniref:ClpXP protease specificity-enhancing factor n=1 Tax=Sediminicurvatus halobius TaxID=2182432 RepID=A0A2U2N7M9_9GAMM|nr:ClpXP protease specificity-enhancing factor [Spiribacter halobius]PWG65186.1 ClpXP protease specificity-enhancing factor [Spiribacter halobius]UEX78861.1 ClpXP protease specificity-enhancing factor [Spiribacter halobius]
MTPSRPYLIRALHEWIVDNDCTPYLLVDASRADLDAPLEYADNGKLVLNVAPRAVRGLALGNQLIAFNARFGGAPRDVSVPVDAVLAIYARENGQGMLFSDDDGGGDEPPPDGGSGPDDGRERRPNLRVVK